MPTSMTYHTGLVTQAYPTETIHDADDDDKRDYRIIIVDGHLFKTYNLAINVGDSFNYTAIDHGLSQGAMYFPS